MNPVTWLNQTAERVFSAIPYDLTAFMARFSMAAVFWKSGQTKVSGFAIDIVDGVFDWGWPRLSDNAVALFREEYKLPLLSPELGASLAAFGEHVLPVMLMLGLATRLSAFGLLAMTAVIQLLVYPGAWPTHGTWAACLLMIMAMGPGRWSLDHLFTTQAGAARR